MSVDEDELMTTTQVADYLKLRSNTLEHWRSRGVGPAFTRVGRRVRYRRSEIDKWVRENEGSERGADDGSNQA